MPFLRDIRLCSILFSLLTSLLLSSCANRTQKPVPLASLPPQVVYSPVSTESSPARQTDQSLRSPEAIVPSLIGTSRPQPTLSDTLATLSKQGTLTKSTRNSLTFARNGATGKPVPASLYEDAAHLGRLRARLKSVTAVPEVVVTSARVQGGVASFDVSAENSPAQTARLIDVSLGTVGIDAVTVHLLP